MIIIKNLTKKFGSHAAVSNMDLSVERNEILALLGHNGAGKTTTINMVTGMQAPTNGDIFINENSIVKNPD
jgi:ABC-type multidrug transport system ATPase subunit